MALRVRFLSWQEGGSKGEREGEGESGGREGVGGREGGGERGEGERRGEGEGERGREGEREREGKRGKEGEREGFYHLELMQRWHITNSQAVTRTLTASTWVPLSV